ncbi:MAG: hypothetical protein AAF391_09025 [Bacteroidota bacterium]
MKTFDQANERFEKAVLKLQENLQYLADQGKVGDRFLSIQNGIIKALVDYQHEVIYMLQAYEQLSLDLHCDNSAEYRRLQDIKESMEAICLIHGIMDFPCWMAKGKAYLVGEAVAHSRDGQTQLPYNIMRLINDLSTHERDTLWSILNKKAMARWEEELNELKMRLATYA